jgi:nitroreductase
MERFKLLATKEAIENRQSNRKFKPDPVSDDIIMALLESARQAPSGCNAQPWRFKIVRDSNTKMQLQSLTYNQRFVSEAPVVLIICVDVQGYLNGRISGVQDLGSIGIFNDEICEIINKKTRIKSQMSIDLLIKSVTFNTTIAVEHIALRALDFGLGTCRMKLIDEAAIHELFNWDNHIHPVVLLAIGYPDKSPRPRKRRPLEALTIL